MAKIYSKSFILLLVLYIFLSSSLLLFSYTQIDLSLTLSRVSVIQQIQKNFQYLGYYNRPLATTIYISIIAAFFLLYCGTLYLVREKKIHIKHLALLISIISFILFFSYSAAFSYDVFNYIFTAKTILLYGKNPYAVTPLDFQGIDSMLSFMRWTHLASAYTPLWMLFTFPSYILSFGSLLLSLWTMKIFPIISYLLATFLVGKILEFYKEKHKVFAMAAFALNPLVIIEVLVSAHNDLVMMSIALLSFYVFLRKEKILSFFTLALSIATKFITIFLLPLSLFGWTRSRAFCLLLFALGIVLLRREFLPWYFLWVFPFGVLFPERKDLLFVLNSISVGLLLRYAVVFYFGNYDAPVPEIQNVVFLIPVCVGCIGALIHWLRMSGLAIMRGWRDHI